MIRRPPRSTRVRSSAASDVYKRQVADRREAQLGGDDQPVEDLPHLVAGRTRRRLRLVQPALKQIGDHRGLVGRPLLGQEHPVDGLLQLGTPLQIYDTVMAKYSRQPRPELFWETLLSLI